MWIPRQHEGDSDTVLMQAGSAVRCCVTTTAAAVDTNVCGPIITQLSIITHIISE
jgi:microcompartment protein CcmK/EutM